MGTAGAGVAGDRGTAETGATAAEAESVLASSTRRDVRSKGAEVRVEDETATSASEASWGKAGGAEAASTGMSGNIGAATSGGAELDCSSCAFAGVAESARTATTAASAGRRGRVFLVIASQKPG